jgi:hypothetical protein
MLKEKNVGEHSAPDFAKKENASAPKKDVTETIKDYLH